MGTSAINILLLDSDRALTRAIAAALGGDQLKVVVVRSPEQATRALASERTHLVIVEPDVFASRALVASWLGELHRTYRAVVPIVLTAHASVSVAVEAMRCGAFDYLVKPTTLERLREVISCASRHQRLLDDSLPSDSGTTWDTDVVDASMRTLLESAMAVAGSRSTVLITGETGTGKSRLARAIHARSPRRDRPFVEVACGTLSESLLASELFGHVKGAFTGATTDVPGRFAAADGGTIFLDEINAAPLSMQVQLLRVLQERTFEPVGSSQTRSVDARTILATNADLPSLVHRGAFREDLFHRINVVALHVPPLRERAAEIEPLAAHFLDRFRAEHGRQTLGFTDDAMDAMRRYPWPGNVRELQHAVERAVLLSRRPVIESADLPEAIGRFKPPSTAPTPPQTVAGWPAMTLDAALERPEREIIEAALLRNDWSRQETARELGIDRTTLYKKMRKYGLGGHRANAA